MSILKNLFIAASSIVIVALLYVLWNDTEQISGEAPPPKSAPAVAHSKTTRPVHESDLNIIELSPEAAKRLALEYATLEVRSMPRSRPYGAEVVLPTDASVIVSAPLAGTLRPSPGREFPQVGQSVRDGEPLLELLPLLTPERSVLTPSERIRVAESKLAVAQAQIDAAGQLQQAKVQTEATQIAFARAQRLFKSGVGTKQAIDDAQAQFESASEAFTAAQARKALVDGISLDEEAGTLQAIPIDSPLPGIVRSTLVQAGQMIAAGAPLFEIMNDRVMWIKVSVYVGELDELSTSQPARLTLLDGIHSEQDTIAKPIAAPPTATPLSAAVDLYYEVANDNHHFRPGQRVAAHLPIIGEAETKTVPWSAVIHDIYGGQWVYEQIEPLKFVRRRVEVGWVEEGRAALLRGPAVGALVVTAGAAELMGTEFGFAK
ncbi:efflux RND transporter periplasmic adaptor subunit [Symmachiella dynata]|uniref:efflux RND transporter periplasmic adaptor subunit n=1 Tax=Symmachiella dynata TaxID=2527995 RepID=UPI0030ECF374